MGNDLAKNDNRALATQQEQGGERILNSDVLIPRLLLMQGLSDFVTDRDKSLAGVPIQQGDMVRSTNKEVIGSADGEALEFIPLTFSNQWMIQELVGKKYEYRKVIPRDGGLHDSSKPEEDKTGEGLPWDFKLNGTDWRRVKVFNVFALLTSDIEAFNVEIKRAQESGDMPDLNKTLLPLLISFRSTSYNAGKAVATHFTKAASMAKYGTKAYGFTLKLEAQQEKNEKGTYYVFTVGQGRKCNPTELAAAADWVGMLKSGPVKVDETIEDGSSATTEEETKF